MESLTRVVADVSEAGGYFHLYTDEAPGGPWHPLRRLLTDGDAFAARVEAAAERIGAPEPRVAASVLHLGLAARIWSPVLGAAVAHRVLLDWTADGLEWKDALGGPLPLRLPSPSGRQVTGPAEAAEPLFAAVEPLLEALNELVLGQVKLARRLLWGNAASALGGTVRTLATARPDHAADALTLGKALLTLGPLRDTGSFTQPIPGRPAFTRTTCCLYYRIPHAGKCGDCALLAPTPRQARRTATPPQNP